MHPNEKILKRFKFLHKIYELSGQSPSKPVPVDKVYEYNAEAESIVEYLRNEGLIDIRDFWPKETGIATPGFFITHDGILEVEKAQEKPDLPTEHFPPSIYNITINGDMISNIQDSSPNAFQEIIGGRKAKESPKQKIRVLFVSANPIGTVPLELIKECNDVRDSLTFGEYGDQFDFDQRHEVSVTAMDKILLDYKPQVLHFSGHGDSNGVIVFQDRNKEPISTSVKALSELFRILNEDNNTTNENRIRLVFLNACYAQKQAAAISKYVDCVVGMSSSVSDDAARVFAESFYLAIGFGKSIKTAFDLGCNKVERFNIPEKHVPKLLHRPEINPALITLAKEE